MREGAINREATHIGGLAKGNSPITRHAEQRSVNDIPSVASYMAEEWNRTLKFGTGSFVAPL